MGCCGAPTSKVGQAIRKAFAANRAGRARIGALAPGFLTRHPGGARVNPNDPRFPSLPAPPGFLPVVDWARSASDTLRKALGADWFAYLVQIVDNQTPVSRAAFGYLADYLRRAWLQNDSDPQSLAVMRDRLVALARREGATEANVQSLLSLARIPAAGPISW